MPFQPLHDCVFLGCFAEEMRAAGAILMPDGGAAK
jgi:co-chaperonin GroES (HSP10)